MISRALIVFLIIYTITCKLTHIEAFYRTKSLESNISTHEKADNQQRSHKLSEFEKTDKYNECLAEELLQDRMDECLTTNDCYNNAIQFTDCMSSICQANNFAQHENCVKQCSIMVFENSSLFNKIVDIYHHCLKVINDEENKKSKDYIQDEGENGEQEPKKTSNP